MVSDKRRYPRHRVAFPIEHQRIGVCEYSYTVTKDLSLGGVKILSDKFVPKGRSLRVKLNLVKKVFNFKTEVAWCTKERFSDRYYLGCKFTEVPQDYDSHYRKFLAGINQ